LNQCLSVFQLSIQAIELSQLYIANLQFYVVMELKKRLDLIVIFLSIIFHIYHS